MSIQPAALLPVIWSKHARERAVARCDKSLFATAQRISEAVSKGLAYQPSARIAKTANEQWVACDGPLGKATAVIEVRPKNIFVITIRESETCGQGERAHIPLTSNLGEKLRKAMSHV